jgi:hypothetical protein
MKNIFLLPTDKPTGIFKSGDNLLFSIMNKVRTTHEGFHIYITSDEEIKEGKWCYNSINNNIYKKEIDKLRFAYEYKIILTTDQSLDGIQEIDDEFLEWFIKNPSCEKVEIRKEMYIPQSNGKISDGKITHEISLDPSQNTLPYYKINIPKEELNPTTQVVREAMRIVSKDVRLPKVVREGPITFREGLEKSKYVMGIDPYDKQETLEELVKEFYSDENQLMERIAFKRGYTECEERMYSEEDMRKAFKDGSWVTSWSDMGIEMKYDTFEQWFEQFKKK